MTLPQNLACFKWKILSNAMAMWQADRDSICFYRVHRKNLPRNFFVKKVAYE